MKLLEEICGLSFGHCANFEAKRLDMKQTHPLSSININISCIVGLSSKNLSSLSS